MKAREELTVPSAATRGRLHDRRNAGERGGSPGSRWRTPTQRDHDRLLYSSAFQRLGGITQVAASEAGRPFHTRLTHTLKVAQVARRSAERLQAKLERGELCGAAAELVRCLDTDAVESAALAHDLGHPPFGHLAEQVLREKAQPAGGFEGNAQSFRIVVRLALRDTHDGLDLTRQTLNGMLKYPWRRRAEGDHNKGEKWGVYDSDVEAFDWVRSDSPGDERSLEAILMDWADDITYAVHDMDDFARAGLIPLDRLARDPGELRRGLEQLAEWNLSNDDGLSLEHLESVLEHVDLEGNYQGRRDQRVALRSLGSMLITRYIEALDIQPVASGRAAVVIDPDALQEVRGLKFLTQLYVITSPQLAVVQRGQRQMIGELWDCYDAATKAGGDIRLLPSAYREQLTRCKLDTERVRLVTDLVAGMTESTVVELHARMTGTSTGSVLDAVAYAG